MANKKTAPPGANVTEETVVDEAAEKMSKISTQQKTFDLFLETLKEEEAKSLKPRSGDYEVIKDLSSAEVQKLQAEERLVGFQKFGNQRVCLVLKEAFIEKKESLKK